MDVIQEDGRMLKAAAGIPPLFDDRGADPA